MIKNVGRSVRDKLFNISRVKKLDFLQLAIRYLNERLLYRLAQSAYKDKFYLKGGVLLYALERDYARPTLDIDFLGNQISNNLEDLKKVFQDICSLTDPQDGVYFDISTLSAEEINASKDYQGVRLTIIAQLDSIRQPLKIDVGFGDILFGKPQILTYQSELQGLASPQILVYTLEMVVAEKFQAMIELSELNTRLKDLYDVYVILTNHRVDQGALESSIEATFINRYTSYTENHPLFTEAFAKNKDRVVQWKSLLKKLKQNSDLSLEIVMQTIKEHLEPIFEKLS